MAQETLNGLLQYVLVTLPFEDKVWFKQQMEQDIQRLQAEKNEIDAIDMAVDMSLEDIACGRTYTQEQAKQMRANLLNREERQAQKRAKSFAKLQEAFADCDLTDEEIRQECESVRQEMYNNEYAH